jgi:hypothetical protein
MGAATLLQPEAGVVVAGLGTHGQSGREGLGRGLTAAAAQAGLHQQPAGVDGGDAIASAQIGEGEPFPLGGGAWRWGDGP